MASKPSYPGVIPPPPGTVANIAHPLDQTKQAIILHTVCLFFVTICLVIRIYTRKFINNHLSWDDYCCIITYIFTIIFSAILIEASKLGLGRHLWDITFTGLIAPLKLLFVSELIYIPLAGLIKLSCLLFYSRIFFHHQTMRFFIIAGFILVIGSTVSLFFATLFDCVPVKKSWDGSVKGHCIEAGALPWASGAINVLNDLYVLILPMPCIWTLEMAIGRKIRLLVVFALGIFACAASITRLKETSILFNNDDRTWNLGKIEIWSVLEVNVGIICTCLLAFPSFIEHFKEHGLQDSNVWIKVKSYLGSSRSRSETQTSRSLYQEFGRKTSNENILKSKNSTDDVELEAYSNENSFPARTASVVSPVV